MGLNLRAPEGFRKWYGSSRDAEGVENAPSRTRLRRINRGAKGAEGSMVWGIPLPSGGGVWRGDTPSPDNFCIFCVKIMIREASFHR